jgi:hypothetical protein
MQYARFETKVRYYKIYLQQDLLDDWVVTCAYGGKDSNRGQVKHFPLPFL